MASANDLRKGMALNYNGDISVVLDMQHRTPGNLRAFVQASLRSIRTGKTSDVRFSSTEKIDVVPMMTRKMDFSYKDGEDFVFSDPETYETTTLVPELVGEAKNYLVENGSVTVTFGGQAGAGGTAVQRGFEGGGRAGRDPGRFFQQRAKGGGPGNGHHGAGAAVHQDGGENQSGHPHGEVHGEGVNFE